MRIQYRGSIRLATDPAGEFTRAWDVELDVTKLMGNT